MLHEKIKVVEYQNALNLVKLEEYERREDVQMKKVKEHENEEKKS